MANFDILLVLGVIDMAYDGITKKIMKNGSVNIFVRFAYQNVKYNRKNFTKLFGIKTEKKAFEKLNEIKVEISKGNNPFVETKETLDELWKERFERKVRNGEWTNNTPKNYEYFYNAHIKEMLGWKKISKITYHDLLKVYDSLSGRQGGTRNTFKRMMRPLFDECVKSGLLEKNVVEQLPTQKEGNNKNIELRTSEDYLNIVRMIYNAIPYYDCKSTKQELEIKAFLYMIIMTAHRMGEIRKLKKENLVLEENKIIAPPEITKTHEYYHFPIPPECREYFESIESGLLFPTIKRGSTYQIFQRLLQLTDIKFYNGKTLSIHDSRRLMLKVMIVDCGIDSMLADSCLSHKQQSVIKHYLHFSYKDIEGAYQKFWKKVRDEEDIEDEITLNDIPKEMIEMVKQLKRMKLNENKQI